MCAPCYETEVIQNLSEPQYIYITLVSYSLLINYIEIVIQTALAIIGRSVTLNQG